MRDIAANSIEYGWRVPSVRYLMLAAPWTGGVGIYVFYALQPYLLELYGDPTAYGIAGLVAAIVAGAQILGGSATPFLRRLFHRRTSALITAEVLSVAALVGIGLIESFGAVIALISVWGLLFAASTPIRQAYLNGMIPSQQRATILSFDSLMSSTGGVVAQPVWAGRRTSGATRPRTSSRPGSRASRCRSCSGPRRRERHRPTPGLALPFGRTPPRNRRRPEPAPALQLEQEPLALDAARVAGELPARTDHPVARDDDRDRVPPVGHADRARGAGPPDPLRELAVAGGLAVGISRRAPQTSSWKGVPNGASGRSKSVRSPAKYWPSCSRAAANGSLAVL